ISQFAQSRGALRDCLLDLSAAGMQPRHEQATEHGFALQSGGIKKLKSRGTEATSLKQPAFLAKQQSAVQINQRRPNGILFAHKDLARLSEQFQGAERLPLLAESSSQVCQTLGMLISHAQCLGKRSALAGGFFGFLAQVEVEL